MTLIFSLDRYRAVMQAFLVGLEQAREHGIDLSTIESVASFFVSRVDGEIDKRLEAIGYGRGAAPCAARPASPTRGWPTTPGPRSSPPRAGRCWPQSGAHPQRPLWASTGVKNPEYPSTLYVDQLVAPGVVNTMPGKTLEATEKEARFEGGTAADTVSGTETDSDAVMDRLERLGVSYADVTVMLEKDGVDKFQKIVGRAAGHRLRRAGAASPRPTRPRRPQQ